MNIELMMDFYGKLSVCRITKISEPITVSSITEAVNQLLDENFNNETHDFSRVMAVAKQRYNFEKLKGEKQSTNRT